MAYYNNDNRIGRRGKAAQKLMDCYQESMRRSERAVRYARQDYDGSREEES